MSREWWGKTKDFFDTSTVATCINCDYEIMVGEDILTVVENGREMSFCDEECYGELIGRRHAHDVPEAIVEEIVFKVHQGACVMCGGNGPIDIFETNYIVSFILGALVDKNEYICCHRCGQKKKILSIFWCTLLGWWSIPTGILMTPVQIAKNIRGLFTPKKMDAPSDELFEFVQQEIAIKLFSELDCIDETISPHIDSSSSIERLIYES